MSRIYRLDENRGTKIYSLALRRNTFAKHSSDDNVNMSRPKCSCESFEKFVGASVPAYIASFLDELKSEGPPGVKRYQCRECARGWEKRPPEGEEKRPTLARLN